MDTYLDWSVGFSGLSKVLNGTTQPGIELDYESRNMRGTTYATLGEGKIVIGGEENPLALATINRDPAGRQVVTINESTKVSLDIPVLDFRKIADDARSATDLMRALTTPVPDDVAAMGEAASDYYRRGIASGLTPAQVLEWLATPEISEFVRITDNINQATTAYAARGEAIPQAVILALANGEKIDFSNGVPEIVREGCAGDSSYLGCRFALTQLGYDTGDPAKTKASAILAVADAEQKIADLTEGLAGLLNRRAEIQGKAQWGVVPVEYRAELAQIQNDVRALQGNLATQVSIYELCAGVTGASKLPAQSLLADAVDKAGSELAANLLQASFRDAMRAATDLQRQLNLPSSGGVENADFVVELAGGGVQIAARWVIRSGTAYLIGKTGQTLATATGDLSEAALSGIARETAERFALVVDSPMLVKDPTTKTWMSQSGLEFGTDQGNNSFKYRLQHVMAHLVPDPNKSIHSVFSVRPNELVQLLDEAWLTVQSIGLQPSLRGARATYDIPMGRVVGTNGETSIRIVVEHGTSRLVTGFPIK